MKSRSFLKIWIHLISILVCVPAAIAADKGTEALESLCVAKQRSACFQAAEAHLADANFSMAMTLFKSACFLKHKPACIKLAELALDNGLAGLAREALEEGCRFQSAWACTELAKTDVPHKKTAIEDPEARIKKQDAAH